MLAGYGLHGTDSEQEEIDDTSKSEQTEEDRSMQLSKVQVWQNECFFLEFWFRFWILTGLGVMKTLDWNDLIFVKLLFCHLNKRKLHVLFHLSKLSWFCWVCIFPPLMFQLSFEISVWKCHLLPSCGCIWFYFQRKLHVSGEVRKVKGKAEVAIIRDTCKSRLTRII